MLKKEGWLSFYQLVSVMNIFFLHPDYEINATWHVDRHVPKMALEIAQILSNHCKNPPYKKAHYNHPMAVWVRQSYENFQEAVRIGLAICNEYTYRYGKVCKVEGVLKQIQAGEVMDFPVSGLTRIPRCFSGFNIKETDNVYDDYRAYYVAAKQHLKKYTKRECPKWF